MANILVVDDELGIRDLLLEILNDEGHAVEVAENAAAARLARQAPCARTRVAAAAVEVAVAGHVWEHTATHVGCRRCGRKSARPA
jgi:DNA-binding NtrC family response regulator